MKKYIKPEINILLFDVIDVIATSEAGDDKVYNTLTTIVNNNEGIDYGAQNVSVFDN